MHGRLYTPTTTQLSTTTMGDAEVPPQVEDIGLYHEGRFHPIHLDDRLSKYTVLDKLGYGGSSTVWLCRTGEHRDDCVAVAVYKARTSRASKARIAMRWWQLRHGHPDHPSRVNVLVPIDWFDIEGPNGSHFCLVFTVEGKKLSAATKRGKLGSRPLPLVMAKRVSLDMIQGLEYAHDIGLTHSGWFFACRSFRQHQITLELHLHPQNVLLGIAPAIAS